MQAIKKTSLLQNAIRGFASQNTFLGSINPDLNHNLRVVSTPEWPVPYYQRAFRHPASLEKRAGNLLNFQVPLHDMHVLVAKEVLKTDGKGYVVEAIENHYNLESYRTQFKDSSQFSRAYLEDLAEALHVSQEQNARILNEHDLADVLH
eukprot:403349773